ncbi:MAG: LuxR C-terminal-related transcriptional regulator [Candidatus Kapaibacterium sp.]
MAGRKRLEITESSEQLRVARIRNRGKSGDQILELLIHLKEHPSHSIKEVSRHFSLSERTIYRWLRSYREHGLDKLLAEWNKTPPTSVAAALPSSPETKEWSGSIPTRVRSFLNQLPITTDTIEWCRTFKTLLREFFDDVDQVVINIRTTIDLVNPASNRPGQVHRQSLFPHKAEKKEISILHDSDKEEKWEQIYEEGIRNGFPAELYREPVGFDYYYQTTGSYIGTIILFSKRERPPLSAETITLMEELRPFLLFILSDHIARHRMAHPEDILFRDLVSRINNDAHLSQREQEILMLLVLAYSYDEIAATLFISVKTVESHIQAIYRKVGVQNLKEVFARYVTPRLFFLE